MKKTIQTAISNASHIFNPAYKEFRFKDYSPKLFAKIRHMCSINTEEYAYSFETTCKEKFSEGRSGAFMFFSSNQYYIAKSTNKNDILDIQKLLPSYIEYLTKHPNSLITRFLGAHCITMYGIDLYFVVMLNCLPSTNLSERYDLKGSWVNRHALTKKQSNHHTNNIGNNNKKGIIKNSLLYLDNDLQHKLSLHPGVSSLVVEQIIQDVQFLTGRVTTTVLFLL